MATNGADDEGGGGLVPLGRLVMTRGVHAAVQELPLLLVWLMGCLARHEMGDWGELDAEDRKENELSLRRGFRLLSCYPLPEDRRVEEVDDRLWIITEADRSATTLLWPSEY
jgi:hypothetical protein